MASSGHRTIARRTEAMTEPPLDASTRMAAQRTRLAQERTLMAWIRTSMSLITFGFTIFKFFEYLASDVGRRQPIVSPWIVGMVMIVVGLLALALAWIQNRQQMKDLEREYGPMPYSISGVMAGVIGALGVLALAVVALRY